MLINFEIILILPVLSVVSNMKGTDGPTELIRTQRLKKEVHCESKFKMADRLVLTNDQYSRFARRISEYKVKIFFTFACVFLR